MARLPCTTGGNCRLQLGEPVNGDEEAGRAKLKELAKAGRYQRDVY